MSIINIPEKYWLKVDNFDIETFCYEDFRILELLSSELIKDFKKYHKNYDDIKEKKKNKNKIIKKKNPIFESKTPFIKQDNSSFVFIDTPNTPIIVNKSPQPVIIDIVSSPEYNKNIDNYMNMECIKASICSFTNNLLNRHIRN